MIKGISGTRITVESMFGEETIDLGEFASIDLGDIQKEYVQQPGLFAFVGALLAEAKRNSFMAKVARDQAYAVAYNLVRDELEIAGKKPTEKMVEADAKCEKGYLAAVNKLAEAEWEEDIFSILTRAMEQRKDMLVSVGSDMRQERGQFGMKIDNPEVEKLKQQVNKLKNL